MCFCGTSNLGNTGQPTNADLLGSSAVLIAQYRFQADGTRNSIPADTLIDQTYVDAKINNANADQRWYPIGKFSNVTEERAEPNTETIDNIDFIANQGARTFLGWLVEADNKYIAQLQALFCNEIDLFYVNTCNELWGNEQTVGGVQVLQGVKVQKGTFNARLVNKSIAGNTAQKIEVTFAIENTEQDADLSRVDSDWLTADMLEAKGLIPLEAKNFTSISTTGFTFDLSQVYGGFNGKVPATGWVAGDFTLVNTTDNTTITITSVTESAATPAQYAAVFPAQTASDVLTLSGAKTGFVLTGNNVTIS